MATGVWEGSAPEKLPDSAHFSVSNLDMCPAPPLLNWLASSQEDIGLSPKLPYNTLLGLAVCPPLTTNCTHTIMTLTSSLIDLQSSWAPTINNFKVPSQLRSLDFPGFKKKGNSLLKSSLPHFYKRRLDIATGQSGSLTLHHSLQFPQPPGLLITTPFTLTSLLILL